MPVQERHPKSVADAVETFVGRSGVGGILSVSDGVRTVRHQFPQCEHTDDELVGLIAGRAIARARNVAFDRERSLLPPDGIAAA
jgi:hypothetical protein